jgi:hypothetical protein
MLCSLSKLEQKDVDRIKALESDLDKTILAFSCHDLSPSSLDGGNLEKIKTLEKEMGISLVAVDR